MQFDPLLTGGTSYETPIIPTEEEIRKRYEAMQQQFRQVTQPKSAPIWDEIDRIVDAMSDSERQVLAQNEEFSASSAAVQSVLQREILRSMRPVVEATKDGKAALEAHLALLKKMQKQAKDDAAQRESLMNEYIMNYSDMSWQDFIAMKQGKTTKKTKK